MAYQGRLPYTYKSPYNYVIDQGTQTVPSLAFVGDTNNGIFSPSTDVLAITTNGSERLRVDSFGKFGMGTTPDGRSKLTLSGTFYESGQNLAGIISNLTYDVSDTGNIDAGNASYISTVNITAATTYFKHYIASLVNVSGAGSLSNNIGFFVDSSLGSNATTSYGFYSNLVKDSYNHWNFYGGGNAPNHLRGEFYVYKTLPDYNELGVEISADTSGSAVAATRNSNICFLANRKTSDGALVSLRRDNNQVGSIDATTTAVSYNTSSTSGVIGTAADIVTIKTGGESTLTVRGDSQQRVGIGITSPRQALDVNGNTSFGIPGNSWNSAGIRPELAGTAGILYSHGAFRASWVCNGYRNNLNQWTSSAVNSQTGAAMIEMDPTGYVSLHTDANKASGSGTGVPIRFYVSNTGNIGIGTVDPGVKLDINDSTIRVRTSRTISTSNSTGSQGEICWDANYVYVCTATNTWKRSALSSW